MMKTFFQKILFSIIIVLALHTQITLSQSYDWRLNGNHIYYGGDNYGNVGIGDFFINQPSYKLHVLGDMFSTGNIYGANGNTFISSDENGAIEVGFNNTHGKTPYIDFHWGTLYGQQDFNARIMNSDDNRLDIITNSGPKLTFNGTASGYYNLPALRLTNTNGMGNSFEFQDINGMCAIDFWHDGTNAILDFYADYQNHPEYNQFSVKRDNNFGNSCGWGNDESWLAGDRVYLGAPTQGPSIHLNQAGSIEHNQMQPYISFAYGNTGNSNHNDVVLRNTGTNKLDFFTNTDKFGEGGKKIMQINNDGVFAIRLTVQTNWSDFVFKPEYKLSSLEEVEKYIIEKGHLEGIPTEQEVKENGVDLGDVTAKLLKKIEELTLYIIEQNKEIKELKEKNRDMK